MDNDDDMELEPNNDDFELMGLDILENADRPSYYWSACHGGCFVYHDHYSALRKSLYGSYYAESFDDCES